MTTGQKGGDMNCRRIELTHSSMSSIKEDGVMRLRKKKFQKVIRSFEHKLHKFKM
jgi:hypothetical protein